MLLDLICEELGVEVGEDWIGSDGYYYHINEYGQVRIWSDEYDEWTESYYNLGHVINGDLRPIWKPKKGGLYYIPAIYDIGDMWQEIIWLDDTHDIEYYNRGLVFKTKEEAVDAADKMIKTLKEDK